MKYLGLQVLITGAASGIGAAMAAKLTKFGAKVWCLDPAEPEAAIPGVEYLPVDITNAEQVSKAVEKIPAKLDYLLLNAGVMRRGSWQLLSEQDFDLTMNVNLKGSWLVAKAVAAKMNESAKVLLMSSKNGLFLKADTFVYSISKLAVAGFGKIMQQDHPQWQVKVAFPGLVDTKLLWQGTSEQEKEAKMQKTISSDEMAELLLNLLNAEERFLVYDPQTGAHNLHTELKVDVLS